MTTDIIFCSHNRREFTRFALTMLIENTDWSQVRGLYCYDDHSMDGTLSVVKNIVRGSKVKDQTRVIEAKFNSSVGALNDYVRTADSDRFCKIDSDIIVPPGWLQDMSGVMDDHPEVDLLGMEAGRMGYPGRDGEVFNGYGIEDARWIGGVGMMKTSALGSRPAINQNGRRFGFTEWQQEYDTVVKAWIKPDLAITDLSRIPFDPWRSLSDNYRNLTEDLSEEPWERSWPRYHEKWMQYYWEWWPEDHARYAT